MYGEGCYIEDHEGRRYLDCLGGYGTFALGHRHPTVVAAVKDQLDSLAMSGKAFFSKPAADLAAELASIAPGGAAVQLLQQLRFRSRRGRPQVREDRHRPQPDHLD